MLRSMFRVAIFLMFLPLVGCAPSQADIEKSIREEMKSKNNVNLASFDLKKNDDGSYAGTATADNGDVYDVSTTAPKGGKTEWRAYPSQSLLEKGFRTDLESKLNSKVKTLTLTKHDAAKYTGAAELENGLKFNLRAELEGTQFMTHIEPVVK